MFIKTTEVVQKHHTETNYASQANFFVQVLGHNLIILRFTVLAANKLIMCVADNHPSTKSNIIWSKFGKN